VSKPAPRPDIAVLLATSGHSGVDRVMSNLLGAWADAGLAVDLLGIHGHGPHLDPAPAGLRRVPLPARHVNTALPALLRYLRRVRPPLLLTDKDRVNRLALLAATLAGSHTRVAVRLGTTVSVNLAGRGRAERALQRWSMRRLYPRAAAILTPSAGAADDLCAFAGLPRGRVQVVPSPVLGATLAARAAQPARGVHWPDDARAGWSSSARAASGRSCPRWPRGWASRPTCSWPASSPIPTRTCRAPLCSCCPRAARACRWR
jgi:hypothetical protein